MIIKCISSLFLILLTFSYTFGSVTSYEMIDIDILSAADESEAIAINDKGQVLGKLKHEGKWDVFLWEKESGLQVLDLPDCGELLLNNNGQIAGVYSKGVFIWDKVTGFYKVGAFDGEASIEKLNDKGQILIRSWKSDGFDLHTCIWDHGIIQEISRDFLEKFPGYSNVHVSTLNNKGDMVLKALSSKKNGLDVLVEKSFMWSDGKWTELFKEYGDEAYIYVRDLDDDGNMLVEISHPYDIAFGYSDRFYFMNLKRVFQAEIVDYSRNIIIRNLAPQIVFCTPSVLKTRFDGVLYYAPGAEIRKLMKPQFPYWFQTSRDLYIRGQNSQGYVVGDCETVYLKKRHAFLAVPFGTKL